MKKPRKTKWDRLAERIAAPYKEYIKKDPSYAAVLYGNDNTKKTDGTGKADSSVTETSLFDTPLAKPHKKTSKSVAKLHADIRRKKKGKKGKKRRARGNEPRGIRPDALRRISKLKKAISPARELGPDSLPEPNDYAVKSLHACSTVEEVGGEHTKWGRRFNDKVLKAIKKRKISDDSRLKIEALLDGTATSSPILTNNKVLEEAWQHVHRQLVAMTKDDPEIEFAMVTFISGDGGTSANAPVIELYHSREAVLRVLRSMALNFIGMSELAMFKSHRHPDGGRYLQRHEHVLIYGKGVVAKAEQVAQRRMSDFPPNITDAPQIDVRRVKGTEVNLARVCAYLFKSPHKSMNWCPPRNGKPGHMNQTEKGERPFTYLRMAQIRSMLTIEDVLFAGGACKQVKKDLVTLVEGLCRSHGPAQSRLLHPDAIASFWAEVNKELRRPQWRVPVIARNP